MGFNNPLNNWFGCSYCVGILVFGGVAVGPCGLAYWAVHAGYIVPFCMQVTSAVISEIIKFIKKFI